ncbi:MAG: hypothetical protein GY920_21550 [Aliivibrio sp.]|nr:hypothetical protein [Aliivibrio sp.]MCP4255870.1 hypothetical protein [Candidatus Scalindua sp.]|tara:strand:+ start:972 stop:1220 length:249 start_codon:yes stop_codon:yes gene_type:complete
METKLVNYKLPLDLIEQIESMSKGNKTALVVELLQQALAMRSISEAERQRMYSAVKRYNYETNSQLHECPEYSRNLIDGLWI